MSIDNTDLKCPVCGMEIKYHADTCTVGGSIGATAGSGRRTLAELVREVMNWHRDTESPEYNECDKIPCAWCTDAIAALGKK